MFILFASFAFVRLFKLPDLLFKVVRLGPFDVEVLVAIEFASIRTVPKPVRETWVNRRCPVILLGHVLQQWSSFTVLSLDEDFNNFAHLDKLFLEKEAFMASKTLRSAQLRQLSATLWLAIEAGIENRGAKGAWAVSGECNGVL